MKLFLFLIAYLLFFVSFFLLARIYLKSYRLNNKKTMILNIILLFFAVFVIADIFTMQILYKICTAPFFFTIFFSSSLFSIGEILYCAILITTVYLMLSFCITQKKDKFFRIIFATLSAVLFYVIYRINSEIIGHIFNFHESYYNKIFSGLITVALYLSIIFEKRKIS